MNAALVQHQGSLLQAAAGGGGFPRVLVACSSLSVRHVQLAGPHTLVMLPSALLGCEFQQQIFLTSVYGMGGG